MKAIITKQVSNARNYANEKETVGKYIVLDKTGKEFVDCRVYMGRSRQASTVYASIWVRGAGVCTSGRGSAGGYGYHKESAAIQDAIGSAGIELYGDVYGADHRWNYDQKRENTPAEIAKIKRRMNKRRAYIDGAGDQAIRAALLAIAKAAGLKGKPLFVSM